MRQSGHAILVVQGGGHPSACQAGVFIGFAEGGAPGRFFNRHEAGSSTNQDGELSRVTIKGQPLPNQTTCAGGFMKHPIFSDMLKQGLLLMAIFCTGVSFAQDQYLTKSVTNGVFTWNIESGIVKLCISSACASPEYAAPAVPLDAQLIMVPNGGLWIVTADARYQIFCSIEPTCLPPKAPLAQATQGMRYRYRAIEGRLSAVRDGSSRTSWCSDEPNCTP